MTWVYWLISMVAAYLFGSLNFAIIVTRIVESEDIRTMGNRNPGTANVGRSLGTGWGALVLILDISKGVAPLTLAAVLGVGTDDLYGTAGMLTVGIAAVVGHCKPLYYGFRGGKGIATSIGVYVMLAPVEGIAALFLAAGIVAVVIRNVDHKFGPYTPIFFVILAPVLTAATALFLSVPVVRGIVIGGHLWYEVLAVLVLSLTILALNPAFAGHRIQDYRSGTDPSHVDEEK